MDRDRYVALRGRVSFDEVSLGFRTVRLLQANELTKAQEGYAGPGWSADWLVIAEEDELGDPIVADLGVEDLPVFTAAHGEGEWEPIQLADSFAGFVAALEAVAAVSPGREDPVSLEENPVPDEERERLLAAIRERNPNADPEFWESWLEA